MAADLDGNFAPIIQDETADEDFQDASTESFEKENNVGEQSLTEVGGREDVAVQAEPICKESSPRVSGAAVELAGEGDADTTEGIVPSSNQSQEGAVKDETDEVLGGDDEDTEGKLKLVEQQFVEERLEEAEQAVMEDVPGDRGEGEMGKSEPDEQVAVDNSEQKEGSDLGDSESSDEELAYEAETDSIHSEKEAEQNRSEEEEEGEQSRSEEEEGQQNGSEEEEEGEQNRSGEEEAERNRSEGEEEGEQNRSGEEVEAEGSGWEEPVEGGDVDADEKKTQQPRDPSLVPRDNRYFLHDMRDGEISGDVAAEQDTQ